MPTPTYSQISMQDVYNETNFTREMSNFYSTSQIGGLGGLMYHNLNMGPGNNQTAFAAIYTRYVAIPSADFALSQWYNYSQTPNLLISWNITNNNVDYDIVCQLYITDPGGASTLVTTIGVLFSAGGNDTQTNFDTGIAANATNFANGVYEVEMVCTATYVGATPPGPGVNSSVLTCSDMDAGTIGSTRVGNNPPAFTQGSPTPQFPIVQGVDGPFSTSIYVNKRTTFSLTFV